MITLQEINTFDLETIYTFRYTDRFVREYKQLQSLLNKIEGESEGTKRNSEIIATIFFLMGRMKDVVNTLKVTQTYSPKCRFLEAVALKNTGYMAEAKEILENLLSERDIKKELVVKELVEIYLNQGAVERAKEIYENYISNKESIFAKFVDGRLLEYEGYIDEAVAIYEKLKETPQLKVEALHRLFYLANIFLEPEEIKKYEEEIQQLPQGYVPLLVNLALSYDMQNRIKEAIKEVEPVSSTIYNPRLNYLLDEIKSSSITFIDEDVERQKRYTQKLLEIPLEATGLSIRTRNILMQKNIKTIGDLIGYTEADIQSITTLQESGFKEIKDMLAGLNLEFAKVTHIETEEEKKYLALLNQSISNVYWTPQARALLEKNNIKVWGDLANLKEEEINRWHGITTSIFNEIKQKMLQQGIMFRS